MYELWERSGLARERKDLPDNPLCTRDRYHQPVVTWGSDDTSGSPNSLYCSCAVAGRERVVG